MVSAIVSTFATSSLLRKRVMRNPDSRGGYEKKEGEPQRTQRDTKDTKTDLARVARQHSWSRNQKGHGHKETGETEITFVIFVSLGDLCGSPFSSSRSSATPRDQIFYTPFGSSPLKFLSKTSGSMRLATPFSAILASQSFFTCGSSIQ